MKLQRIIVVREFVLFESNFQSQVLEKYLPFISSRCNHLLFRLLLSVFPVFSFQLRSWCLSSFKYAPESISLHVLSCPMTFLKIFDKLYIFQSPDGCLSLIIHLCSPFLTTHSWYLLGAHLGGGGWIHLLCFG